MSTIKHKLTLYPACYQIKVPGHLDASGPDWPSAMTVYAAWESDGRPVTVLTGTIDQAALQGLLRRLYALGLPLISVIWLEESDAPAYRGALGEQND
jgi:hypothetical protein